MLSNIFTILLRSSIAVQKLLVLLLAHLYTMVIGRNKNLWVFGSFTKSPQFTDNSMYLYKYILNGGQVDIQPVWLTIDPEVRDNLAHRGYDVRLKSSVKAKLATMKASVIVIDSSFEGVPWEFTGGAKTVQLTHGIPLKSPKTSKYTDNPRLTGVLLDYSEQIIEKILYRIDFYVVSSDFCDKQFKKYANLNYDSGGYLQRSVSTGTPIYTGFPKTDQIQNVKSKKTTCTQKEQCGKNPSISIGYFPTYRDYTTSIRPFDEHILDQFCSQNESEFIIKPHRLLTVEFDNINKTDRIIYSNSSHDPYSWMHQLDVFITDYSSMFFDFLLLNKPILIYQFDRQYFESSRGLMPNFDHLTEPFQCNDTSELVREIQKPDLYESQKENIEELRHIVFADEHNESCKELVKVLYR